jgi:hypothetical protein
MTLQASEPSDTLDPAFADPKDVAVREAALAEEAATIAAQAAMQAPGSSPEIGTQVMPQLATPS